MARRIVYSLGGYDPTKPNNNIVLDETFADPEPSPKEQAQKSAIAKLKKLGLSDSELETLFGE